MSKCTVKNWRKHINAATGKISKSLLWFCTVLSYYIYWFKYSGEKYARSSTKQTSRTCIHSHYQVVVRSQAIIQKSVLRNLAFKENLSYIDRLVAFENLSEYRGIAENLSWKLCLQWYSHRLDVLVNNWLDNTFNTFANFIDKVRKPAWFTNRLIRNRNLRPYSNISSLC